MKVETLPNYTAYEMASGSPLHGRRQRPETLFLDQPNPSAANRAFLAHRILTFGACDEGEFIGCEIAIDVGFQGEPLDVIEQQMLEALARGFGAKQLQPPCVLSFDATEFDAARALFAFLCAHEWESQLICRKRDFVCNVSHDEYFFFHSGDAHVLETVRVGLKDSDFQLTTKEES